MQNTTEKDNPKISNPRTLLSDAFSEYRPYLEKGDMLLIAKECGEDVRTVRECFAGNFGSTDIGKKVFAATRKLILKRTEGVKKLVA